MSDPKSDQKLIDFSELKDSNVKGEELQALAEAILKKLGHRTSRGGRGPDGGRDLYCYELVRGDLVEHQRKWLVQCKDHAKSEKGRAVSERDLGDISGQCTKHQADGYLLITTTTVTSELSKSFEAYTSDRATPFVASYWDEHHLRTLLLREELSDVLEQFLPESYKRVQRLRRDDLLSHLRDKGVSEDEIDAIGARIAQALKDAAGRAARTSSRTLYPFATPYRDLVDRATQRFFDEDVDATVEVMLQLPYEEWSALAKAFTEENSGMAAEVLTTMAKTADDDAVRYNAVSALADFLGWGLDEVIPHIHQLDGESLELLAQRFDLDALVHDAVEKHVVDHETRELQMLPAHMTEGVTIEGVEYSLKSGDLIRARVHFAAEVEISGDGGEDYTHYSLPGTADLAIHGERDIEAESVKVSTSDFYGEDEPPEPPPEHS